MIFFGKMENHGALHHLVRLMFAFYIGAACWLWREYIRVATWMVLALAILNMLLLLNEIYYLPAQIILTAALAIWIGSLDLGTITTFSDKQDYSYAIYITGYPIQQSVIAYTGILEPWHNFAVTMAIVLPIAALSWNFIENPVIRLKNVCLPSG